LYDLEKLRSAADTALLSNLTNVAPAELTLMHGSSRQVLDCHGGVVYGEEEEKK
jgi:hypothetical protein